MKKIVWAVLASGLATAAAAQQVNPVSVVNAPAVDSDDGSASDGSVPEDEGDKAVDRGGLSSRGGTALQSRRTFQDTIRTEIYTPIGTSQYTPVQRPPESDRPQS